MTKNRVFVFPSLVIVRVKEQHMSCPLGYLKAKHLQ